MHHKGSSIEFVLGTIALTIKSGLSEYLQDYMAGKKSSREKRKTYKYCTKNFCDVLVDMYRQICGHKRTILGKNNVDISSHVYNLSDYDLTCVTLGK